MKFFVGKTSDEYEPGFCKPVCITEKPEKYGYGYVIYKILENGKLKLVKDWEKAIEKGCALYYWNKFSEVEHKEPIVLMKFKGKNAYDFSEEEISEIIEKAGFDNEPDNILGLVEDEKTYCEELPDGRWMVFGEYCDGNFPYDS